MQITEAQSADDGFDIAARQRVIVRLSAEMTDHYVLPEVGRDAARALMGKSQALANIDEPRRFAEQLTEALRAITHDKHVRVMYVGQLSPTSAGDGTSSRTGPATERYRDKWQNSGIDRVERLPGNIGYIDLRSFVEPRLASESITAAMTLVAHADALIFDMRGNGGGSPATIAFLSSYLFDKRTHLNDLFWRGEGVQEFWTSVDVPGPRFGEAKPLYVLISHRTFSGGEEFGYNLQVLRRATLIGEQTGGGANPGELRKLSDDFEVFVPEGRAVNPVTKTNWEGSGVTPDVVVPAESALDVAEIAALTHLISVEADGQRKRYLESRLIEIQSSGAVQAP